jgi:fructokinase
MPRPIFCFGEVLWDVLPQGRFLGGAPLNVAYHLSRLGNDARLISAVGRDALGEETVAKVKVAGIDADLISRHPSLPTGTVTVTLDVVAGQASYEIRRPVAWDAITSRPPAGMKPPAALIFGSLALRGLANREVLRTWLLTRPVVRLCDLNLRPPFDDVGGLDEFVTGCTVLKVNEDEARRLSPESMSASGTEIHAAHLADRYACEIVCVTLGAKGALLWRAGNVFRAESPRVEVRDTIGAGDAFTAALLDGVLKSGAKTDWASVLGRACALGAFVASKDGAQPKYELTDVPGLKVRE